MKGSFVFTKVNKYLWIFLEYVSSLSPIDVHRPEGISHYRVSCRPWRLDGKKTASLFNWHHVEVQCQMLDQRYWTTSSMVLVAETRELFCGTEFELTFSYHLGPRPRVSTRDMCVIWQWLDPIGSNVQCETSITPRTSPINSAWKEKKWTTNRPQSQLSQTPEILFMVKQLKNEIFFGNEVPIIVRIIHKLGIFTVINL